MTKAIIKRRDFIKSLAAIGVVAGSGVSSTTIRSAKAQLSGAQPLANKLLIDLFLDGGPDFRHLIVPEYVDPNEDTSANTQRQFAQKYWQNRVAYELAFQNGKLSHLVSRLSLPDFASANLRDLLAALARRLISISNSRRYFLRRLAAIARNPFNCSLVENRASFTISWCR